MLRFRCSLALSLEVPASSLFMRLSRPPLQNPPGGLCPSKLFLFISFRTLFYPELIRGVRSASISLIFKSLRTLFRKGALPSSSQSITSALFPIQRRGEGICLSPNFQTFQPSNLPTLSLCQLSTTYKLLQAFTPLRLSLFSCTYALPSLQLFSFDHVATVPGVGGSARGGGVKVSLELPAQRIEGEKLTSWNFLKWVLPNLQLRTYDLRLFREDHHRAAPQAKGPRRIPFIHTNLD